jgi:glycosyltransferase involved in cell wall biosynthesis
MQKKLVGVLGSGLIGTDPFERQSWSGSSYFFFTALKARGRLHRAFGVEAPAWRRWFLIARNFRRDREAWRRHFYLDTAYRDALTHAIGRRLEADDFGHDFLQLGALYDVPALLDGRARCFSYHDGNLAQSLRSPYVPQALDARKVENALAFERRVYHGMTRIFTMSEYLRQSFIRDFGVPPGRVVTVGAGINLDAVPAYREGKRYDRQELLFIGKDFERKGGWVLLEAFRAVRDRCPAATLHLVGPRELTVPPGLAGGVEFHGFLDKDDPADVARLEELFRRSCLFVMPSLYEPFGIAPLEAMVHQVPCVVTDGWALREMVTPGETGDLAERGRPEDLADKLVALLADPDGLRRMGESGRRLVLERFTWDKVAWRLVEGVETPGEAERPVAAGAARR